MTGDLMISLIGKASVFQSFNSQVDPGALPLREGAYGG